LSTIVGKAKIGAMAIAMAFTIASCGAPSSTESSDSTNVDTTFVAPVVDTVSAPVEGGGSAESAQPIK
jgi:ABC-type glycerol-3-phosphate transport system substrate-binding protein